MQIHATGFKVAELGPFELGRLNLLIGPNGSGKSAVADAIRYAPLGYVPQLGKREIDTAALMSGGSSIRVQFTIDERRSIVRELTREPDGALKDTVRCSWINAAKSAEHHAAALSLFGREEADIAEILDIRELLTMTPNKRAARIEQMLSQLAEPAEEKARRVARFALQRLSGVDEDRMPADYTQVNALIPDGQLDVLRRVTPAVLSKLGGGGNGNGSSGNGGGKGDGGVGIATTLAWVNSEKRRADNEIRHKRQAAEELKKRLSQIPEASPNRLAELTALRDKLERDLGAACEKKEQMARDKVARGSAIEGRDKALAALQMVEQDLKIVSDEATSAAKISEMKFAAIEAGLAELSEPEGSAMAAALPDRSAELAEAERLEAEAVKLMEQGVRDVPVRVYELKTEISDLMERLILIEKSPWSEVVEIGRALANLKSKVAKNCGARLIALAEANDNRLRDSIGSLRQRIAEKQEELKTAEAERKLIEAANVEVQKKDFDLRQKAKAIRQKVDAESREARQAWERQTAANRARRMELVQAKATLEKNRAVMERQVAATKEKVEAARRELASAEGRLKAFSEESVGSSSSSSSTNMPPPAPATLDVGGLQAELSKLTVEHDLLSRTQASRAELEEMIRRIETLESEAVVFEALEWALQRAREIEISQAGGPLRNTTRNFLAAAGRDEIPYLSAGNGVCEIGWTHRDGAQVGVQAMSGGEYALFTAALTTAVIVARAAPVRVLLVEAGETDEQTLGQILKGIEASAEQLSAALVMTCHPLLTSVGSGWTIRQFLSPAAAGIATGTSNGQENKDAEVK